MVANNETKQIKIAMILGRTLNGGTESLLYNYCSNMNAENIHFDFFVENTCEIINEASVGLFGGNIVKIPSIKSPDYEKVLTRLFKENEYDIVQANINALNVLPLHAAKKAGIPIRISNSLSTSNRKEVLRHCIKMFLRNFSKQYATHFFACSDNSAVWLFGKKILKNPNYYRIFNAVDISDYSFNSTARKELACKHNIKNRFVVGTIGRLEQQKNQEFLINVFNELHKVNKNAFLMIIGDGHLKDKMQKKIVGLGLEKDAVILSSSETGVKKECAKYYSLFDVFVLPSLYEGLPVVGIEAQLASLPCVFSDNVSREVGICSNISFVSLKEGNDAWAQIIEKTKESKREPVYSEDYDIKIQSKRLKNLYLNICSGDAK